MIDNIFISYSKTWTRGLAEKITDLIEMLYAGKDVNVFFDRKDIKAGKLEKQLDKNIRQSNIGVLLLTPENYASEWLMFEAGALTQAIESKKNGVLIPYLFCRDPRKIENPIHNWTFTKYTYKGNNDYNRNDLIKLFQYINDSLDESNRINSTTIETKIIRLWDSQKETPNLSVFLHDLAQNLVEASASSLDDKSLHSIENDHISLEGLRTRTDSQFDFSLADSITPRTPRQLETAFEFKLNEIPKELRVQNLQDKSFGATRVILNSTRFSTFVALTDKTRIVLFDRKKANPKVTNVLNDRYDVFGSVQFENRTLNMKISSQKFLDSPIQEIREINGAAIEDNEKTSDDDKSLYSRETAVMFGICVYMRPEDLNLAIEDTKYNEIIIVDVSSAKNWESSQLTSKARLAVRYLSSQLDKPE